MRQGGFIALVLLITVIAMVGIGSLVYFKGIKSIETTSNLTPQSTVGVSTSTASSHPSPQLSPSPTPTPKDKAVYSLGVLVIKYFPVTSDEKNIDISVTGDVGDSYELIRQRTNSVTTNLKASLEKASKYLGYRNPNASSSLVYQIVDTKEYKQAVPLDSSSRKPLYKQIMQAHNICDYVDNKNVREVWLWAYQGPNKSDGQPYLAISESKMSGPFGDISNSFREADMPVCKATYRVYTFNYGRGTSEAIESWGHQMETELDAVDRHLFRDLFQASCGTVHNPPNARFEYDRENPTTQQSDCLDWQPDEKGTLSNISCVNWGGCGSNGDDSASLRFQVWYWQNLPGLDNTKTYQGKRLRNWWSIHGDFDNIMRDSKKLTL